MKILIVNTYDITGGAARATFRLCEALIRCGADAKMLVARKRGNADAVIALTNGKIDNMLTAARAIYDRQPVRKYKKTIDRRWGPFSPARVGNRKLIGAINSYGADIVHLCWITHGMIAIEDLSEISAPIVWRLPDMWAFTGGCHYACDVDGENVATMCDKYTRGCCDCGILGSGAEKDLSYRVFERKRKAFAGIKDMTVIGVSKWLADCAKKSALFSQRNVICLPNPLNTNIFKPVEKLASRKRWDLTDDRKRILFGAVAAASTPYKGYDLLIESLKKITSTNVECVVFGTNEPDVSPDLPFNIRYVGHVSDDIALASLYSACDVMVVPSRREAFGQTASESLSCGTPVVAFGVGGLLDIVDHKQNGYLAKPFDTGDLADGIDWVLNNENPEKLSQNARAKAVGEYDYGIVAKKYIDLYRQVSR